MFIFLSNLEGNVVLFTVACYTFGFLLGSWNFFFMYVGTIPCILCKFITCGACYWYTNKFLAIARSNCDSDFTHSFCMYLYLFMISAFLHSSTVDNCTELVFPTPECRSSFFLSNILFLRIEKRKKDNYTKKFSPPFYSVLIQKIKSIYLWANSITNTSCATIWKRSKYFLSTGVTLFIENSPTEPSITNKF